MKIRMKKKKKTEFNITKHNTKLSNVSCLEEEEGGRGGEKKKFSFSFFNSLLHYLFN